MSAPLTLLQSADLLGRYRYVELAGFRLLGERARSASPGLAGFLSGASLAHAYRAGCFEALLPVSTGLPGAAAATRSPGRACDEALALLAAAPEGQLLAGLLEQLYPAMLAAWERHRGRASPAADPPLLRVLGRAGADLAAVLEEGRLAAASLPPGGPAGGGLTAALGGWLKAAEGPFGPLRVGT